MTFTLTAFFPKDYKPSPQELENGTLWCYRNNLMGGIYEQKTGNKLSYVLTSGYRTPEHNAKIGGAKNSFHPKGMAGDILDTLDQLYGKWIVAQGPLFLKQMQLSIENPQFTKKKTAWVHTDLGLRGGEYKVFIP